MFFLLLFCPFSPRDYFICRFFTPFFQYLRIDCAIFHLFDGLYLFALSCMSDVIKRLFLINSFCFFFFCFSTCPGKLVQKCALFHGFLFVECDFIFFSAFVAFSLVHFYATFSVKLPLLWLFASFYCWFQNFFNSLCSMNRQNKSLCLSTEKRARKRWQQKVTKVSWLWNRR